MKKTKSIFAILFCFACTGFAQTGPFDVNFEFQAYPAGLIPGLRLEKGFAQKNAASLRLGYQFIDHQDFGKHDDETGSGYGFTLGYKRYLKENFVGWFAGLRNDFWWNEIDWEDAVLGPAGLRIGTTDIFVVQPTVEAGYAFALGQNWVFSPALAFGFEVNVKTEGEPTGEGAIFLLGLNFGRRF